MGKGLDSQKVSLQKLSFLSVVSVCGVLKPSVSSLQINLPRLYKDLAFLCVPVY